MVAGNPLKVNAHIGEPAFFILVDSEVFKGSRGEPVPILAGDGAGMAARAPALIKEEAILSH
jgi:hypothetical protein